MPSLFEAQLIRQRLLPILRLGDPALCLKLGQLLSASGFEIFEISLVSADALRVIQQLAQQGIQIGAGTVLNAQAAKAALEHGAQFLVSPGLSPAVAAIAAQAQRPYLPGVYSPSEIMQALELGLDFLKLFPAGPAGKAYLKQLKGPFPEVRWLVTGGIEFAEIQSWLDTGADVIGYGSRLVSPELLAANDWQGVARQLRERLSDLQARV